MGAQPTATSNSAASATVSAIPERRIVADMTFETHESARKWLVGVGVPSGAIENSVSGDGRLGFKNRPDVSLTYPSEGKVRFTVGGLELIDSLRQGKFSPLSNAYSLQALRGGPTLVDDTPDEDMLDDDVRGTLQRDGEELYLQCGDTRYDLTPQAVCDLAMVGTVGELVGTTFEARILDGKIVEIHFE